MYRPPSRSPRGAWARHIHEKRRDRGLSQSAAFELLYEGLGLSPRSRSAYLAIDMGDRQPNEREAAYLASVFGWPSTDVPEAAGATESNEVLVAAIDRQTAMLERLLMALTGPASNGSVPTKRSGIG